MRNLLEETLEEFFRYDLWTEDIQFIGSLHRNTSCTWKQFRVLASEINYYPGYGSHEIIHDLVIIFSDGARLNRREYDGSEWWAFTPGIPKNPTTLTSVVSQDYRDPRECTEYSEHMFEVSEHGSVEYGFMQLEANKASLQEEVLNNWVAEKVEEDLYRHPVRPPVPPVGAWVDQLLNQ